MQLESFNELIIWMVFQVMAGFREEPLVLPFLWAQDGFSEPSGKFINDESSFPIIPGEEMAHKIGTGLKVPGLATVSCTYIERAPSPIGTFWTFWTLTMIIICSPPELSCWSWG